MFMDGRARSKSAWLRGCAGAALFVVLAAPARAQDLDPRAYVHVPVNGTFLVWGLGLSTGGIVTDPTLVVTDVEATVLTPSVGAGRSFGLFGRTAQAFAVVPFSWADVSGKVGGTGAAVERAGLSDMRLRLSWLFRGAPAASVVEIAKAPRRTILGMSINVAAPTGEYDPQKLINLGANRWAFKPELGLSHPRGPWTLEAAAGVWLFEDNGDFFPGGVVRSQDPLWTVQGHVGYTFKHQLWVSIDATFYAGGETFADGVGGDTRQENSRLGATLSLPLKRGHTIKLLVAKGVTARVGSSFETYSVAYQFLWFD